MCYEKEFENKLSNKLGNDDEHSMRKKELKEEIDEFEEKIRALTEEKEKYEKEYNRLCNLKKYENLLKDDSNKFREFKILIGCRKKKATMSIGRTYSLMTLHQIKSAFNIHCLLILIGSFVS